MRTVIDLQDFLVGAPRPCKQFSGAFKMGLRVYRDYAQDEVFTTCGLLEFDNIQLSVLHE